MHVLVEVGVDVLHREEARAAVDGLLERVRAHEAEALQHERVLEVDEGEAARRDVAHVVADRAAEVPLRLRVLGPLDGVHRVRELELRRAAGLALEDVVVGRIRLHELAQLQRTGVAGLRHGRVRVVDPPLDEAEGVLLLELLEHGHVVVLGGILVPRNRGHEALRPGLHLVHGLRGLVHHQRVLLALAEGLVPDLPLGHHVLVARHERLHVPDPGGERLRIVRDLAHLHAEAEVAAPHGVAVGDADPGLHAHRGHLAHLRVEPGEVVLALLLLGLGPAAEEAPARGAEVAEEDLVLVPVGVVAVHRLAADGPHVRADGLRGARLELAGRLEVARHLADLLERHAPLLLERPGGRHLAGVAPGVPALDLGRVLERHDLGLRSCCERHAGKHGDGKVYKLCFHVPQYTIFCPRGVPNFGMECMSALHTCRPTGVLDLSPKMLGCYRAKIRCVFAGRVTPR